MEHATSWELFWKILTILLPAGFCIIAAIYNIRCVLKYKNETVKEIKDRCEVASMIMFFIIIVFTSPWYFMDWLTIFYWIFTALLLPALLFGTLYLGLGIRKNMGKQSKTSS